MVFINKKPNTFCIFEALYGYINVVRVPGGWIYETTHELSSTTTFVPIPKNLEFNNEKPNPIRVDTDQPISKTESLN